MSDPRSAAAGFSAAFPKSPPLVATDEWLTGTWMIGACYKNPNRLYGAYPHSYLDRVHAMFPDARQVLHVFSGGMTHEHAVAAAERATGKDFSGSRSNGGYVELVDMHGPEQGRFPTWQGDLFEFCDQSLDHFDLILADPPYSAEDAKKYDCPAPNRAKIMRALRKVAAPGADLVWLDQVWPMHRKDEWRTWGTIGLVRSTNHRVRLVSIFKAV